MKAKIVAIGKDFHGIQIKCPGCSQHLVGATHMLPVRWLPNDMQESADVVNRAHWSFNGQFDNPTFHPSLLCTFGCEEGCGCEPDDPDHWTNYVCHSFIENGRIQYLSDCTHSLAGQCVDLPDYP